MKHELMRHPALGKQIKCFESIKKENDFRVHQKRNLQLFQFRRHEKVYFLIYCDKSLQSYLEIIFDSLKVNYIPLKN